MIVASTGTADLTASAGSDISLSGSSSSDPDGDILAYKWRIVSKPAASNLSLANDSVALINITPDVKGLYTIALRVIDSKGAFSDKSIVIDVNNTAPQGTAAVVSVTFNPVSTIHPAQNVSVAGSVLVDATYATDPDGDPVSISFALIEKPIGSSSLLNIAAKTTQFSPDAVGTYKLRVRGIDASGASFESIYVFTAANRAPTGTATAVSITFTVAVETKPTQNVTIGDTILLNASGSTDPDGDPVTVSFTLTERPQGSSVALSTGNKTATFVPDQLGTYKVKVRGTDPSGAAFETNYSFNAANRAPVAVLLTDVTPVVASQGQLSITASVGYTVQLDGQGSTDPDGNSLTYLWEQVSKPAASAISTSSSSAPTLQFSPDVLGTYIFKLKVTDPAGAASDQFVLVDVTNQRPVASISTNTTPNALPSAPTIRVPVGSIVTLRGAGSTDADGDAITYAWSIVSQPVASTATLSATTTQNVTLTPDADGVYVINLRVTDGAGAYSERTLTIEIGNYPPVAVIDRSRLSVLSGDAATASAALSFDEEGSALTYMWAIDTRPVGSVATISNPTGSSLNFTPDVPGQYVASVTVSDGTNANVAYVNIRAMATLSGSVTLPFVPGKSRFSRGLDKLVTITTGPDAARIVDPFTGAIKTVALPLPVKSFQLSPDGKLAAVLHEGVISLVDVDLGTLIRSSSTSGSQTDAFVTNDGKVYLIGQTSGQWVYPNAITIMNGRTGAVLGYGNPSGTFYGTQRGIFADKKNRVFYMAEGLSPSDINYFGIDPSTGAITGGGDSPYHGNYSMGNPLYLSEDQAYIFTVMGTYFRTSDLTYAGTIGTGILSLTHSSQEDELLKLSTSYSGYYPYTVNYSTSYQRYTGPMFLPDAALDLPLVNGQQSYGLDIFHSANGHHVVLVQTGSATTTGASAYYLIYR